MEKISKIVYNANGVDFTIYATIKLSSAGPRTYWLLEDYSTGKRRLLNHPTELAARQRADQIRAAMAKGQANRLALNNGLWQDVSLALEIVRSTDTGNSLATVAREWAECDGLLVRKFTILVKNEFGDVVVFSKRLPAETTTEGIETAANYLGYPPEGELAHRTNFCDDTPKKILARFGELF